MKRYAGEDAIVSRYGGEEFVLLLLRKDAHESAVLAEELRELLMAEPYAKRHLRSTLRQAWVVAEYSSTLEYGTMVLEDMVSRADHALYRAKSGGRNRVEVDSKRLSDENDHV